MIDTQNNEIGKIIKRLELIKSLIALEEESEINTHLLKLEQFALTPDLKNIISLLQEKAYSKVVIAIGAFINQYQRVTVYVDPEIDALKLEIKVLETEINKLSDEKADVEKLIHEFNIRHNKELGELLIKILRYRKNKAQGTPQQKEAEEDYNTYQHEYEATKNEKITLLNEEEQKELKDKYRKASKLCHPDCKSSAESGLKIG